MTWRKRKAKGSPDGGQFVPDMSGKTSIPTSQDIPLDPTVMDPSWSPDWQLEDYARKADIARELYREQVARTESSIFIPRVREGSPCDTKCGYCHMYMNDHVSGCPLGSLARMARSTRWLRSDGPSRTYEDYQGNINKGVFPEMKTVRRNLLRGMVVLDVYVNSYIPSQDDEDEEGIGHLESKVRGEVTLGWSAYGEDLEENPDVNPLSVNAQKLKCSCPQYAETYYCQHIDAAIEEIYTLVGDEPNPVRWWRKSRQGTLLRKEYAQGAKTLLSDDYAPVEDEPEFRVLSEAAQRCMWEQDSSASGLSLGSAAAVVETAAGWRTDTPFLYTAREDLFSEDMQKGKDRWANGQSVVGDLQYEDVLDGACLRGNGQAFGIELEYDMPMSMTQQEYNDANKRIAKELYEAGITSNNKMNKYGASRGHYTDEFENRDGSGTWSLERDGTVAGELVTSGLYDEPRTWERLATAIEIITRNGGIASGSAGGHIHVGTDNYQRDPAAYAELMRLAGQNEDAFIVMATNPETGTHRRGGYALPLPSVPPQGFINVESVKRWQEGHGGRDTIVNALNVGTGTTSKDHVEFRAFDATLDPAVIQFQVKLAVAMTNTAARRAAEGGTRRSKDAWGTRYAPTFSDNGFSGPSPIRDTLPIRSLLDTVFHRPEDKAQGAALAGVNTYSIPVKNIFEPDV